MTRVKEIELLKILVVDEDHWDSGSDDSVVRSH
jgi:hypothetical protein